MATQAFDTYSGYNIRCRIYIKEDGSGDAPADWDTATVNTVGIATSVELSGNSDVTEINGLNQQEAYNTKSGTISYDFKLEQLFLLDVWTDDAGTPNEYHPGNMIKSGKKFAIQVSGMNGPGETATASEFDIECTRCSIGSDSISVDSSDGNLTLSMEGKFASRDVTIV